VSTKRVEWFVIGPKRAWNIAVVGRESERPRQPSIEPDQPGLFIDLVLVATTARCLHHDIDQLHAEEDRASVMSSLALI
jgi:hypothetical protein